MDKSFHLGELEPFIFEVGTQKYSYTECLEMSSRSNFDEGLVDSVLKTRDGKYIELLVKSAGSEYFKNGITKGTYTAKFIEQELAEKLINSK